jgi:hypothetical protein
MTRAPHRKSDTLGKMLFTGLMSLAALPVTAAQAQDNPFDRFPVVIQCKYRETYHAFYLARVSQDGTATYSASDRIAGTITIDGKAKAVGVEGGGSCLGKTLAELRASHQAYDLKR